MDLEDAIEDAEEKGWSETLVFHEIFDTVKEIKIDPKVNKIFNNHGFITANSSNTG